MITNLFAENFAHPWGVLHILSIVVLVASCAGVIILAPRLKASKNSHLIMLITVSTMFLLFEAGKQIIRISDGIYPEYWWADFPVVPCSIFMYITVSSIFFRNKPKVVDTIYLLLATYGLFSGIAVYAYPNVALGTAYAFITIQSFTHHGLLVFVGVYLFTTGHAKLEYKTFLHAILFFIMICILAIIINLIVHLSTSIEINMMFINPWIPSNIPILKDLLPKNFFLAIVLYILAYTALAAVVFGVALLIKRYVETIHNAQ